MNKIVSGMLLLLITLPVLAEEAVQAVPRVETNPTAMIVFAALFVAMIGGFFYYLSKKDSTDKKKDGAE